MPPLKAAKSRSLHRTKPVIPGCNTTRTDIVLPMNQPYMRQIVSGVKTYEFRKYRLSKDIKRVWFYVTAPESRISHICDIGVARTRGPGDTPLPSTGLGNKEYNERHPDWDGYDYAYEIESVYELTVPLELKVMKEKYGWKGAPRGLVYVSAEMRKAYPLEEQIKVLHKADSSLIPCIVADDNGDKESMCDDVLCNGTRY